MTRSVARMCVEIGYTPEQVEDLTLPMFVAMADYIHERMELAMMRGL